METVHDVQQFKHLAPADLEFQTVEAGDDPLDHFGLNYGTVTLKASGRVKERSSHSSRTWRLTFLKKTCLWTG